MTASPLSGTIAPMSAASALAGSPALPSFEELYADHADFIWRSARRLGVTEGAVEDVVQEVFLVAHRRLRDFEPGTALKAWLWRILTNVVQTQRRTQRRKSRFFGGGDEPDPALLSAPAAHAPDELAQRAQATRILHHLLDQLDDDKRAVFVLVELEELSVVEATAMLDVNLNTMHARLRAARRDFARAAQRYRARQEGTRR